MNLWNVLLVSIKISCTGAKVIQIGLLTVSVYVYPCSNDVPVGPCPFDL